MHTAASALTGSWFHVLLHEPPHSFKTRHPPGNTRVTLLGLTTDILVAQSGSQALCLLQSAKPRSISPRG